MSEGRAYILQKDFDRLLSVVCPLCGVRPDSLTGSRRASQKECIAKAIICHFLSRRGYTPNDIAGVTGRTAANVRWTIHQHYSYYDTLPYYKDLTETVAHSVLFNG